MYRIDKLKSCKHVKISKQWAKYVPLLSRHSLGASWVKSKLFSGVSCFLEAQPRTNKLRKTRPRQQACTRMHQIDFTWNLTLFENKPGRRQSAGTCLHRLPKIYEGHDLSLGKKTVVIGLRYYRIVAAPGSRRIIEDIGPDYVCLRKPLLLYFISHAV